MIIELKSEILINAGIRAAERNFTNAYVTKRGDSGTTDLIGEKQVSKDDQRVCAYGELDELNVYIGGCVDLLNNLKIDSDIEKLSLLKDILLTTQNKIFNLGNTLGSLES